MRVGDNIKTGVAFIGFTDSRGQFVPYGSGFLSLWNVKTLGVPLVVTARHVIEGPVGVPGGTITVRVNDASGFKDHFIPRESFFFHPEHDPNKQYIDVAVAVLHSAKPSEVLMWIREDDFATDDLIRGEKIGLGDEVVAAGLLLSHYGEKKHIPIVRVGNIAAMRDEPVPTDLGYMDAFLVEMRSLGGVSGSAVLLHMPARRALIPKRLGTMDYYVLGLIHGYYGIKWEGEMVKAMTTLPAAEMNSGIAIVVPFSKIVETITHPDVMAELDEWAIETLAKRGGHPA